MDFIAIDFETQSRNPQLGIDPYSDPVLLTAVALPSGESFVFDGIDLPEWVLEDLKNPKVVKIAHSIPFEGRFIQHNLGFKLSNVWDTLGIERLLTAGKSLSCSLQDVCQRRLGLTLDKDVRDNMARGVITQRERDYCRLDAEVLIPIYKQQKTEILKNGQKEASRIENYASLIASEMQLRGIGFDFRLWDKYVGTLLQRVGIIQGELWDALGFMYAIDMFTGLPAGGPSLNSRNKVLDALKRKGIKLDDYKGATLQEYLFTENNPQKRAIVEKLLEYKQYEKMAGWGYEKFVHPLTGRIHSQFNPQGADTFRWTGADPNLLQVAQPYKDINFRHLFVAAPVETMLALKPFLIGDTANWPQQAWLDGAINPLGRKRKHVGADYSQIELRVLAYVSGDPILKDALRNNVDLHSEMAEKVLRRPVKTKDDRTLGKIINFGVRAYGGSYKAFLRTALDYGVYYTPDEAKAYVAAVKEVNTGVEDWGKLALQQLQRDGFVQTPVGHRRYFFDENRETVARNTPIQCFAAGILKDAMCSIYDELQGYQDAWFNLQVHDEIGIECYEEDAEAIQKMATDIMQQIGSKWAPDVAIKAESYISDSWEK